MCDAGLVNRKQDDDSGEKARATVTAIAWSVLTGGLG